jgi:FAD/FMN-containing dehydrogenase
MDRRHLLQTLSAAAALPALPATDAVATATSTNATRRVRPTDPAWPAPADWQNLKAETGGSLIAVAPLLRACEVAPKGDACQQVLGQMHNPFYIGDQPGGTQVSGWLDAWAPAASAYAVKARNAADVSAAVNFARVHNLRLVVKGGGHSYQGTSNAPDSLLIWTRDLRAVTLHEAFMPQGCEGKAGALQPAVTTESGAMWIDLYDAVTTKAGRYVQGGGCTTVGVAGLIQSGGFGSFSKGFGMAAASLLQAEIVTADGAVRIANACTNPDLFWALKGGGGGSWGVVTKLTLKTHDLPEHFGSAEGKIKAVSDAAFRNLVARFVAFYAQSLFNPHWGEQISLAPDNTLKISMVCQGLDKEESAAVWQPFLDFIKQSPKQFQIVDELYAGAGPAQHWWDAVARKARGSTSMISDPRPNASPTHAWWSGDQDQVGAFLHGYESLWLPASLLHPTQQQRLCNALFAASRYKEVELHFNKGLAGAPADAIAAAKDTAGHPAMTEAFALAIVADGEAAAYPGLPRKPVDMAAAHKDARLIDLSAAELRKIAPDAGSYVSESNYFNARWQRAFWGSNYSKLRAVKDKYDPQRLFFVHHGVGSEDWSADGFTRT